MFDINIENEIWKFKNYLKNSKKILLINHRRMDGDAYGSLAWFYYILEKLWNYKVFATNDETTPESFKFLDTNEIFNPDISLSDFAPDLIISFDVASLEQLWDRYKNNIDIFNQTTWVNIDHHISNSLFWNINIVDTDASSTCEIIWDIIKKFDLEKYVDEKIATFLLTGLITDTNSFFNTNSSAKALQSASEIMKHHPKHQDIIINLFKKKPYQRLKLWWKILESLKDIKNWKIVWNSVPKSLFIQTGTTDKDISGLIDEFLTTLDWLEVWFLLYELEDQKIKWSFRAKTDIINLNEFCAQWWWGWHARASWFVVEGKNIYEVEQEVIESLKKFI